MHPHQKRLKTRLRLLLRAYPTIPYLLKWTAICLTMGACVGTASAWFLLSLDWVTQYREAHKWIIALLPPAGFLIGIAYLHYGKSIEAGNNLIIDAIHDPKSHIPLRLVPFVYLATIITHLFGGSAGREGTALQMAAVIAHPNIKLFRLTQPEKSILLIASIAAGFGSVFGTPLAGAVFGLEVYLIGKIRYHAIFPSFAAALIADYTTRLWNAHHSHYSIGIIPDKTLTNLSYAMASGIIFGIAAALFSKAMHLLSDKFKKNVPYPPLRPVIGGTIIALSVWASSTTTYIGLGIPTILQSFRAPLPIYTFFLKSVATILTLSSGFKGGEVTPLFYIGSTLGNALSQILPLPIGLLAAMGFVSVFGGAANTPIACILMGIELFGSDAAPFLAIACTVSYIVSGHNGIYKKQIIGEPKHHKLRRQQGNTLYKE